MAASFQPLEERLIPHLAAEFPCREEQIRSIGTLLSPSAAGCRALVVHGSEGTGKSAIVRGLLAQPLTAAHGDGSDEAESEMRAAIVDSAECVTARHLFETAVGKVAGALDWPNTPPRCESLAQLNVELCRMLQYTARPPPFRFILVFDAIDQQREAPPTLLPALARLPEIIQCLTVVFIVTSPAPSFLRTSFVPHVFFPAYTKAELVQILSASAPDPLPRVSEEDTSELWVRFCGAVHDALIKPAARSIPVFRHACAVLWPRFVAPISAGTHGPREFSKLLIAARVHLQNESLLDPPLVPPLDAALAAVPTKSDTASGTGVTPAATASKKLVAAAADLAVLLPTTARLLLLSAYLASHNAARHDLTVFSTHHHGRRRRRGGLSVSGGGRGGGARSKHRKIARKLLGAHAFVLERMMAIFAAVRSEWDERRADVSASFSALDADVGMALATLSRLRLLIRVSVAGDLMDRSGKWRVNVGWEVVRGLGRSMGIEVEDWLVE